MDDLRESILKLYQISLLAEVRALTERIERMEKDIEYLKNKDYSDPLNRILDKAVECEKPLSSNAVLCDTAELKEELAAFAHSQ